MYTRITIDVEELRKDLLNDNYGAFFGGGFGGAMYESFEIERASPEQLVRIAEQKGVNLLQYEVFPMPEPEPEPEPVRTNPAFSQNDLFSSYSSSSYSRSSSSRGSSSYSPSKKKKESRQEREYRLQQERKAQERQREKERKLAEIRSREPEEMQKLVDEIESQYGCERKMKELQKLRDQFQNEDHMLEQEEAALLAECHTLEQFRHGYGNDSEKFRMQANKLGEKYRDMIEEKMQLLASEEQLNWTCFREKKYIRSRIKEIDKEIAHRLKAISLRLPQIQEILRDHSQRLYAEEKSFLSTVYLAQKNTKWKRVALHLCMTKYPEKWELYQQDIQPILEYLHKEKKASLWDIYENHPRKEHLSTGAIVKYFRHDELRKLYSREIIKGASHYSIDFSLIEEVKLDLLPWEKEAEEIWALR